LIIYGQGAIRCHPFVQQEIKAIEKKDVKGFDQAFWGHVWFVFRNLFLSFLHAITASVFASGPRKTNVEKYFRRLSRMSAAFAFLSDVAMGTLAGKLKRHEKISGRFADGLSWMYVASCALKRYYSEGQKEEHKPFVEWSCQHALFLIQESLFGIIQNFPYHILRPVLRFVLFPLGRTYEKPKDTLGAKLSKHTMENKELRQWLTADIFVPQQDELGFGILESAYQSKNKEKMEQAIQVDSKH